MTTLGNYINTLKNTFNWKDKSSRKEFWIFHFVSFVIQLTFVIIISSQLPKQITSEPELNQIIIINTLSISFLAYLFFTFFTTISLGVRRLNDIGISKFWIALLMVPFIGLAFYFLYLGFAKGSNSETNIDITKKQENVGKGFIEIK